MFEFYSFYFYAKYFDLGWEESTTWLPRLTGFFVGTEAGFLYIFLNFQYLYLLFQILYLLKFYIS